MVNLCLRLAVFPGTMSIEGAGTVYRFSPKILSRYERAKLVTSPMARHPQV